MHRENQNAKVSRFAHGGSKSDDNSYIKECSFQVISFIREK